MEPRAIGRLKPGQPFRTLQTKRLGKVEKSNGRKHDGVSVMWMDLKESEPLSPFVLVEPRDEMEDDR